MSDIPTEPNTVDVVARITRSQAETKKVLQKSFKLNAEHRSPVASGPPPC